MVKHIQKKNYKILQDFVQKINNGTTQVGNLEAQKHQVLHALTMVQADLKDFQVGLKEKYGEANIDIRTGKIEYNLEK